MSSQKVLLLDKEKWRLRFNSLANRNREWRLRFNSLTNRNREWRLEDKPCQKNSFTQPKVADDETPSKIFPFSSYSSTMIMYAPLRPNPIAIPSNAGATHAVYYPSDASYLSLNSCEKIFCQISIHFCCCAVRGFPGFLNDLVKMSRSRARNVLITSIVFQSETANRARFPSRMKTPANI